MFLSPFADGPIQFHTNPDNSMNVKNITQFGRSFSILKIPYAFKLLIQELAAINIQLRIVTEDNLPQIDSMAFSDNLNKLTLDSNITPEKLVKEMERALRTGEAPVQTPRPLNSVEEKEYDKEFLVHDI